MKQIAGFAVLACLIATTGSLLAAEEGRTLKPGPPATGYACVTKGGKAEVVNTPPPPGFKCPQGQKLVLVSKDMTDALAREKPTETAEPTPANQPPGVPVPPRAKKWTRCRQISAEYWYCCTGSYHNCYIY
ncbi:MAG TPA: hypothetical protein VGM13_10090 [Thermoanaerobaculia bacterium]